MYGTNRGILVRALVLMGAATLAGSSYAIDAPALKKVCDKTGNWLVEQYSTSDKYFGKGTPKDALSAAIILNGLFTHPRDYKESNGPFVSEPAKFLVSQIKDDGSLVNPGSDEWQTLAWTVTALKNSKNEKYAGLIEKVREQMKKADAGGTKKEKWATDDFTVTADQESFRKQLYHAQKLMESGTKEIAIDGKTQKWGDVLAENVIKVQAKNNSFNDDVVLTALALNLLNLCHKGIK